MIKTHLHDLRAYFKALFEACKLTPKPCGNPWYALEAAYARPPRAYHNLDHAVECAMMAEEYRLPPIATMALLYHDAHYVAGGKSNEEESVAILREHFGDWRDNFTKDDPLPHPEGPSPLERIASLIMATKHDRLPEVPLEAWVMDIDMSILGREPEVFAAYDEAIRAEYGFLSDADFEEGRTMFLMKLQLREWIFYSPILRDRFEKQARNNISWRLDKAKRQAGRLVDLDGKSRT